MKIVHISDTHGAKHHSKLDIPECDVLLHTGDIGGRTDLLELQQFLEWFKKQPAKRRIFIAGNHDIILDKTFAKKLKGSRKYARMEFA
jgi:3',5'-cyclic AMP phosphodiesterase CpdA